MCHPGLDCILWLQMLGEYPQESESDYMTAIDSGQTRFFFFFRIRLGKLDNF